MRIITLVAAAAALTALSAGHGAAQYEGPWCANVSVGPGSVAERCDMRSFAMCLEEIKGGQGSCTQNPRYRGVVVDERRRVPRERVR
jgi:hypothetical protein